MSWPSASSDSIASESSQQEIAVAEPQTWGHRGAGHGIDERDWFGAFYVPRNDPTSITPEWPPSAREESESVAQYSTEEQLQSCISCGTPTQELQQLSCGHLWGRACLIARIELALQGFGLNWPARCCQKIDDDEMKSLAPFLGESVVQMYLNKYEEMETPRDQRIYCANPRCSVFLGQRGTGVHLDACLECGTSTCLACGNMEPLHDHDECPSETTRVSHQELINSGKLQQCPGCPEVVELREACNHITLESRSALDDFADRILGVYVVLNFASRADNSGERVTAPYIPAVKTRLRRASKMRRPRQQKRPSQPLGQLVCIQCSTTRQDRRGVSTVATHREFGCTGVRDAGRLLVMTAMID
ncbi:hypothetical protein EPUS_04627 [Endocarpon pusillum Z07020]|uniref:IBR domain-containing protein n=1 Tax=Endocarpon pusillum (strain Z07020 / HMAS-L-300199) TaxID=1263415 RepID=U1HI25_ENDPU|nr:uncharacterized protein EPUS_04627 [Endocarpon pusillum Z07020]ERF68529.1 hypothetical protein EPUS_04627 [Endocarpon pusillum Z07020]